MHKIQMLSHMQEAFDTNRMFIVAIQAPNLREPELIINPNSNIPNKLLYYGEAYCECLKLKANREIAIIAYASGKDEMEAINNITHKLAKLEGLS